MTNPHIKTVPPQAAEIYRLLSESGDLTANEIAQQLNILPNAVYRAAKPLLERGMIEQLDSYPVSFKANPANDALNWYLRAAARSFRQDFGSSAKQAIDPTLPNMTFIKDREALLKIGEKEALEAQKTIDYIVSGHRIPDSTVLAYRKASVTGVKIRCIVQNDPAKTNAGMELYEDMGAEVRYLPNIGIRLLIFDKRSVILASYDEVQSSRAFGIRFNYVPVAEQMSHLFEHRWQEARPLKS